jgi:hypothetical protein
MAQTVPTPSLEIGFGSPVGTARLRARSDREADLRRLALRFRTAVQQMSGVLEVELDDLLVNLAALAGWPEPATVVWDLQLAALATDSATDARVLAARLDGGSSPAEVSPADVLDLLGESWVGDLTSFQRRDIARLLSLKHGANFSVPGAGKTRVGLAVFQAMRITKGVRRLLIVGPKSCYESWLTENKLCLAEPLRMTVHGKENDTAAEALIVN